MIGHRLWGGSMLFFSADDLSARGLCPAELSATQALALIRDACLLSQEREPDLPEIRLFHTADGVLLFFRSLPSPNTLSDGAVFS